MVVVASHECIWSVSLSEYMLSVKSSTRLKKIQTIKISGLQRAGLSITRMQECATALYSGTCTLLWYLHLCVVHAWSETCGRNEVEQSIYHLDHLNAACSRKH